MPSSALIPFLGALGSPINPFKQKKGTLFNPRLLGNLVEARRKSRQKSLRMEMKADGDVRRCGLVYLADENEHKNRDHLGLY